MQFKLLKDIKKGSVYDLKPGSFGIVIGKELAENFNLEITDTLTLLTAENTSSPLGIFPRLKRFDIVAIYSSGHYDYDQGLVFIHQNDARKFFKFSGVEGIRVKLNDMHKAPQFSERLQNKINDNFFVRDWTKENKNWFSAVQIEKRMMFIILMLIIAVAAFNLVSMLVMTVTDKKSDIAILRTIGASKGSILSIFVIQGSILGFFGVFLGVIIGVTIASNLGKIISSIENFFNFELLPKGIYLINTFPSELKLYDVITIVAVSLTLSFLATIYPSIKASNTLPAEALKHE